MPNIELAYGLAEQQALYRFQVADGTTARQAVLHSPILQDFPDADLTAPIGIFGKIVNDNTVLHEHDRVELYRPLLADPKEARRKRIQKKDSKS